MSGASQQQFQQVLQRLAAQKAEMDQALSLHMLESMQQQCFQRCFTGHAADAAIASSGSSAFPSATPVAADLTKAHTQCVNTCAEKFLASRRIVSKQLLKAMQ